jgi:hypothetical protein
MALECARDARHAFVARSRFIYTCPAIVPHKAFGNGRQVLMMASIMSGDMNLPSKVETCWSQGIANQWTNIYIPKISPSILLPTPRNTFMSAKKKPRHPCMRMWSLLPFMVQSFIMQNQVAYHTICSPISSFPCASLKYSSDRKTCFLQVTIYIGLPCLAFAGAGNI